MNGEEVLDVDLVLEDVLPCAVLGVLAAGVEIVPDHGRLTLGLGGLGEGEGEPNGRQGAGGGGPKEGSEHDGAGFRRPVCY